MIIRVVKSVPIRREADDIVIGQSNPSLPIWEKWAKEHKYPVIDMGKYFEILTTEG